MDNLLCFSFRLPCCPSKCYLSSTLQGIQFCGPNSFTSKLSDMFMNGELSSNASQFINKHYFLDINLIYFQICYIPWKSYPFTHSVSFLGKLKLYLLILSLFWESQTHLYCTHCVQFLGKPAHFLSWISLFKFELLT